MKSLKLARNVSAMFQAIPYFRPETVAAAQAWLARADRARRIAATLDGGDAAIADAYAEECEAEAAMLLAPQAEPLAA